MKKIIIPILFVCSLSSSICFGATIKIEFPELVGTFSTKDGFMDLGVLKNYSFNSIDSISVSFTGTSTEPLDSLWLRIYTPDSTEQVLAAIEPTVTNIFDVKQYTLSPSGAVDGNFFSSLSTSGGTLRFWPYQGPQICTTECQYGSISIQDFYLEIEGEPAVVPLPASVVFLLSGLGAFLYPMRKKKS